MDLRSHIRSIPDFPTKGIVFRDICTLLQEPEAMEAAVDMMAVPFADDDVDIVAAPEARGFIFGGEVACRLGAGFVPIRKPGKLPGKTVEKTYELEYGTDTLAMHTDAIRPGDRVLVLDDLLATGGTIHACCELVEGQGGHIVGCVFLIELSYLNGRERIGKHRVVSLIDYSSEDAG